MSRNRSGSWLNLGSIFGLITAVVVTIALYMALIYAPTDSVQGVSQRILYIHAPVAWIAYLAAFVVFVGSIGYLIKRTQFWDQLARSAAELSLIFVTLALVTGSLWGRPIWGTWWTWDARLTTTLILWFIFLGYFMLRSYVAEQGRAATYAAVLGVIGFIDIPIIHMSVQWWRTLHPEPVVVRVEGPNMPNEMLIALLVSILAYTLLFACLLYQKFLIERAKDQLAERRFELVERQAEGAAF